MPEKYTDPTEKAAWEIFVQLVGHGKDVDTAAPDAFDAVERFDRYCDERRKKTAPANAVKRNRSDPTRTNENLYAPPEPTTVPTIPPALIWRLNQALSIEGDDLSGSYRYRRDSQRRRYSIYRRSA